MSTNKNVDLVRLGTSHSLILGNLPPKVQLAEFNTMLLQESQRDIGSFGLFETSSPNYTTYYPDVTAEDLNPKDLDFINPTFRALSQVIVHKQFNPIDFSKQEVLHASMPLLKGSTINIDHETATGNAIGAVADVAWQGSSTQAGAKVPAGINTVFKIDGKSNPRLARGIMMDPPSVHSTSVTVEFEWEPSHPKMERNEFFNKLGQFDEKGNMYRRVVTKIKRYHEISLVPHGADPYAQLIKKDGKLNNPKYAHISYNSQAEEKTGAEYFFMDFKELSPTATNNIFSDTISNTALPITIPALIIPNSSITKNKTTMKATTLLLAMAAQLGFCFELQEGDTLSKEQADSLLLKFQEVKDTKNSTAELERVTGELTALKEATKEYDTLRAAHTAQLQDARTKAENLYSLSAGTNKSEAVLSTIKEANLEALAILTASYEEKLNEAMPITCSDCKGTNCSRASSETPAPDGKHPTRRVSLSAAEVEAKLSKNPNGGIGNSRNRK